MAKYIFKNGASSTLNAAIGTGDTSIVLASGGGSLFPSPAAGEQFMVVIEEGSTSEWVTCTARSGDTLTVTRNASPSAFNAGATVEHRLDSVALNQFAQGGSERTVTTDPDGSLAASYTGEEVFQSVTAVWWKHITGTTWKAMNS